MPLTDAQKAALNRLQSFYEGDNPYNSVTNPGGFRSGGHLYNFVNALKDIATVITGAAALATEVAANSVQSPKAVRVDADQAYSAGEQAQGRKNLGLATVLSDYAKKAGDAFTGDVTISKSYPSVQLKIPDGTLRGWQFLDSNKTVQWVDYTSGAAEFAIANGGVVWTKQFGDLATRIEDRASAFAAQRIARTGDTMNGTLTLQYNGPNIVLTQVGGSYDKYAWNIYHYPTDGSLYFQDYQNGAYKANSVRFDRNGAINTAQFGDLSARIEYRASAFADDRLNTARGEYNQKVAKSGDTMTGNLGISKAYPRLSFYYAGVWNSGFQLDADAIFRYYNFDDGNARFAISPNGALWTSQFGDLSARIEARGLAYQQAAQSTSVQKSGDTMSGDLSITKAYPQTIKTYPNVRQWAEQVREDGNWYAWDNSGGAARFSVHYDGSLWCSQLGDINSRIESRGSAYYSSAVNDARSTSLQKAGGTMTGDLRIEKAYPQIMLYYPGVLAGSWMLMNDARMHFRNSDSGDDYLSIGTDGSVATKQFGDLAQRIETRAQAWANDRANAYTNNYVNSIKLVYVGDQNVAANWGGGMHEDYGASFISGRASALSNDQQDIIIATLRFRQVQYNIPNQGWVASYYA